LFRISRFLQHGAIGASLAAALVIAPTTSALASSQSVPFAGTITSNATIVNPPPVLIATATGAGSISPLGSATESFTGVVLFNVVDPQTGCAPDSSTGSVSAANGDKVFITSVGQLCLATGIDSGTFVITGGTGQYKKAHGGGPYSANVDLTTGISVETYNGSIAY
jgi:hypothetical protein